MAYNQLNLIFLKLSMLRPAPLIVSLLILSIASFIIAFSLGSYSLTFEQIWSTLSSNQQNIQHTIVWELRAPRAYAAFITGGLLALAGALMQVLLRNPLADPYI